MVPQYPLCTKWRPLHNNWSSNPCTEEEEEEVMEITLRRSPAGWMEIEHQFAQSPWAEAAQEESCCRAARSTQATGETLEPGGIRTGELRRSGRAEFSPVSSEGAVFFVPKRSPRNFPCVKLAIFLDPRARPATRFFCFRYQRRKPTHLLLLSHHAAFFRGKVFFSKGVKWVFETVGNIPRSTMVRAV